LRRYLAVARDLPDTTFERRTAMKKKPGKTRGSARRSTAKDLTVKKAGGVKAGGERVQHSEFKIVKLLDKTSP